MKTLCLALSLLACAAPASAGWTYVDGGAGYDRYLDDDSIDRDGARVQVWELDNNEVADASGVMSLRSRTEYDCEARRYRIVHLSGHSQQMSGGEVLFSQSVDGQWRPVAPETLGEASLRMACED